MGKVDNTFQSKEYNCNQTLFENKMTSKVHDKKILKFQNKI